MFSTLDLKSGYHQIKVSEESRFITAYSTPKGVKQFTRLNFGTNSASEIFQHVVSERLRSIPGVLTISDDILIYGKRLKSIINPYMLSSNDYLNMVSPSTKINVCSIRPNSPFLDLCFRQTGFLLTPRRSLHLNMLPRQGLSKMFEHFLVWQHTVLNVFETLVI